MRFFWLTISAFFCFDCFAGFRVYQLKLTSFDFQGKPKKTQVVLSSLDPYQYEHYYAGYRWMKVELLESWYCPGDTSHFRKYCRQPKIKERVPASLERNKRVFLPYTRQPVIP